MEKGYKKQVNPREINLFYQENGLRERIIRSGNGFEVVN
ncbi:bacillithiol biosynthesis BshC [bacterium]|nr:bacillithiol biosynthesis BshC [bacterium]